MNLPIPLPIDPMLANSVDAIPTAAGFVHEPKWDSFRCIISRDGDDIVLGSRGKKSLTVYFPEVVAALSTAAGRHHSGRRWSSAPQASRARNGWTGIPGQRIHPAASRIAAMLSEKTPAEVICFDILAADGLDLTGQPWHVRRAGAGATLR